MLECNVNLRLDVGIIPTRDPEEKKKKNYNTVTVIDNGGEYPYK